MILISLQRLYSINFLMPYFFLYYYTVLRYGVLMIELMLRNGKRLHWKNSHAILQTFVKSLEVINSYCEDLDLIDVWRIQNPEQRRFTWRQKNPEIQCRLDFFLVSQCTSCNSINTDIAPGYKTDHSLVTLQISTHNNMRGQLGFWKLNTSFLKDEEYIKKIQSIITQTKDEYALDNTVTPNLLWEMIKMKIRETLIEFGSG